MKLKLSDVIIMIQSNMELFEMDFEDKKYGEKAKLLHKHYKSILNLLNVVGKK